MNNNKSDWIGCYSLLNRILLLIALDIFALFRSIFGLIFLPHSSTISRTIEPLKKISNSYASCYSVSGPRRNLYVFVHLTEIHTKSHFVHNSNCWVDGIYGELMLPWFIDVIDALKSSVWSDDSVIGFTFCYSSFLLLLLLLSTTSIHSELEVLKQIFVKLERRKHRMASEHWTLNTESKTVDCILHANIITIQNLQVS